MISDIVNNLPKMAAQSKFPSELAFRPGARPAQAK